jgi:hypothetical protein
MLDYKNLPKELFYTINEDIIIFTLDDLKAIPELEKYISIQKVINNDVYFTELTFDQKYEVSKIFLEKYNFIQRIGIDKYFNYTKLEAYWPNNTYYKQRFNYDPDLIIDDQKLYDIKNIEKNVMIYV